MPLLTCNLLDGPGTDVLRQNALRAADVLCLRGRSVQPPLISRDPQVRSCAAWLTRLALPSLRRRQNPSPPSPPCFFQHGSPVRTGVRVFPSSPAWGHTGMLGLCTETVTAWKITRTGVHFWERISTLQAWLKGDVPAELSRSDTGE